MLRAIPASTASSPVVPPPPLPLTSWVCPEYDAPSDPRLLRLLPGGQPPASSSADRCGPLPCSRYRCRHHHHPAWARHRRRHRRAIPAQTGRRRGAKGMRVGRNTAAPAIVVQHGPGAPTTAATRFLLKLGGRGEGGRWGSVGPCIATSEGGRHRCHCQGGIGCLLQPRCEWCEHGRGLNRAGEPP